MRSHVWLSLAAVATLLLAGCSGNSGPSSNPTTPSAAQTCEVKIMKSHALQTKTRTIKADMLQDGNPIGSTTFSLSKSDPQTPVQALSKNPACKDVQVKAFEGSNPVGVKTLNPAKCPKPLEFEIHVVDDAVHMYSNCD